MVRISALVAAGLVATGIFGLPFLAGAQDNPSSCSIGPPAEQVACYIRNNKVMVFSKSYCGFSMRAKSTIWGLVGADDVHILELDQYPQMHEMQAELERITGARTVPRVFIGGEFIGGGDETKALAASGKLQEKLRAVGVMK